jgi:hypothetical protein
MTRLIDATTPYLSSIAHASAREAELKRHRIVGKLPRFENEASRGLTRFAGRRDDSLDSSRLIKWTTWHEQPQGRLATLALTPA